MSAEDRKLSLLRTAERRARRKDIPFSLSSPSDLDWPEFCPALGVKLQYDVHGEEYGGSDYGPSLDRVRPHLGYTPENTLVISRLANQIKSSAESYHLFAVAEWLKSIE